MRLPRFITQFYDDLKGIGELRGTPYGMTPVLVLAILGMFGSFDSTLFNIGGPQFLRRGDISVNEIILIVQYVGFVALFSNLAVGWYADRHRRVPFVGIGTILSAIPTAFTGFGRSTVSVGAPRVAAAGAGSAVASVPQFSLLTDYYPVDARGRAFAGVNFFFLLGTIAAPAAAGLMFASFGLPKTFVIDAILIGLSGVMALLFLREPIRGYFDKRFAGANEEVARLENPPQSMGEGFRSAFSIRTLRRIFIAQSFGSFTGPVGFFYVLLLADKYSLGPVQIGLSFIPASIGAAIGSVYGGTLVDRFMRREPGRVMYVYGAFSAIAGLALVGYALHPPLVILLAVNFLVSLGSSLIGPAINTVVGTVLPANVRTQGIQAIGLSALPGLLFGFPLANIVFYKYGYGVVFYGALPFFVVAAVIYASAAPLFELDRRSAAAALIAAEEWRRNEQAGQSKMLVCRDLSVEYDGVRVLFGVDFDVTEGEMVALLGTNGAGKSTVLRAISGTQQASGGAIVFEGRDITHMPPHEISGRRLIHMPGGRGLFPTLSVRENLLLATWLEEDPAAAHEAVEEALTIFPALRDRTDAIAGTLSGGQQQMLSLAQAFMMKPRLLMIDELSLGLSPAVVGELMEIVREINRRGVTIILVEQSVNVALELADRAVFLEKGEVRFVGRTADLMRRPDILRAVYVRGTRGAGGGSGGGASTLDRRDGAEWRRRQAALSEAPPVLEADGIAKSFGGIRAIDGVSLALRDGEILGLIGPNGSGKTTLFDVLSGFITPDEGVVRLESVDVTHLSPDQRSARGLLRRFQDARLYPSLTVLEVILIALDRHLDVRNVALSALAWPGALRSERRARARAERLIELLGLLPYRDKFVRELSTGLRRIVDLACVLAAEPRVVLLDEPSSGIAQAEAEALGPLLRQVRHETGCSLLIIEHDMPLITGVADELIAMDMGRVLVRGLPDEVLADERVVASYLGSSEAAVQRSGSRT
ncbi:MAG TPA: MFS transporter [Acidimicrobiales bacterium]|nr:MFS transporter [Acidimicrobiales bacterium]